MKFPSKLPGTDEAPGADAKVRVDALLAASDEAGNSELIGACGAKNDIPVIPHHTTCDGLSTVLARSMTINPEEQIERPVGAPESDSNPRRSSSADVALETVAMGVFGAIAGGLIAWGLDLGLVWQVTAALVVAILAGFVGRFMAVETRAENESKDRLTIRFSPRRAVVLVVFGAVLGAAIGALIGAATQGGGFWRSLEGGAICGAMGISFTLYSLAVAWTLSRLVNRIARPRVVAVVGGALVGSVLGSRLWQVWFEADWLNFGILVVGPPFAAAFLVMQRQHAECRVSNGRTETSARCGGLESDERLGVPDDRN